MGRRLVFSSLSQLYTVRSYNIIMYISYTWCTCSHIKMFSGRILEFLDLSPRIRWQKLLTRVEFVAGDRRRVLYAFAYFKNERGSCDKHTRKRSAHIDRKVYSSQKSVGIHDIIIYITNNTKTLLLLTWIMDIILVGTT